MKRTKEFSVLLMNDWGSSNYTTHFSPIGILESATEEHIREVIIKECLYNWNLDDDEVEDFLNECIPALCGDNEWHSDEYEVAFKLESTFLYE